MDRDEIALLSNTLADLVKAAGPDGFHAALSEFGWGELLVEHPQVAVSAVARLQGEHLPSATVLGGVLGAILDPALAAASPQVALPPLGTYFPASWVPGRLTENLEVELDAVVTTSTRSSTPVIVPAQHRDRLIVIVGEATSWPTGGGGLEERSGWARMRCTTSLADVTVYEDEEATAAWNSLRTAAYRTFAHELIGIGSSILAMTIEHVTSRRQFGRALAEFQVVKHKISDVRTWQETASLAADAAWEDASLTGGLLAKSLANRFSASARAHGQQLLGGMGFSWEHDFHRYLRRALLLEPLLGSTAELRRTIGSGARLNGTFPQLASL